MSAYQIHKVTPSDDGEAMLVWLTDKFADHVFEVYVRERGGEWTCSMPVDFNHPHTPVKRAEKAPTLPALFATILDRDWALDR
jgi:hypothetical protein